MFWIKKGEVENKIPDVSVLTNETYYKTKMLYIEKNILLLLIITNFGVKEMMWR